MTLYLHIGAQKTGSTTIQAALSRDRAALRKAGLEYPEVEPGDPNKVSHYNSFRGFFTKQQAQIDSTRAFVRRINAMRGGGDVLLSSEVLSNWPPSRPGEEAEAYWKRKRQVLLQIRDAFDDKDVRVILCIRERRSYLKSLFKQYMKVVVAPSISIDAELYTFLSHTLIRSDLEREARLWGEVFGDVRVIDFDRHKDGSLLTAFVATLDRPIALREATRWNVSPDWTDLECLRIQRCFGTELRGEPGAEARQTFNDLVEAMVTRRIDRAVG